VFCRTFMLLNLARVQILCICLPFYLAKKISPSAFEELVLKNNLSWAAPLLMKVVHVELAHEGVEISVFKWARERFFLEYCAADNLKSHAIIRPLYAVFMLVVRANVKEFLQESGNTFSISCFTSEFLELWARFCQNPRIMRLVWILIWEGRGDQVRSFFVYR